MKRLYAISTYTFTVICVASLVLLPVSWFLELPDLANSGNAIDPHASISIGGYHCAVARGAFWLFDDDLPYTGSIISFEREWGGISTTERTDWSWRTQRFGIDQVSFLDANGQLAGKRRAANFPGIYYRYFEWSNVSPSLWTCSVSLWYLVAISTPWPVNQLVRRANLPRQFSLRILFVGLTVVAVVLGVFVCFRS